MQTHRRHPISIHLQEELTKLRPEFDGMVRDLMTVSVRRAHLAPVFMATFYRFQKETGRTFVAFVRELDATVPATNREYQHHRAYQAALYLRRLHEAPETTPAGRQTTPPFQVLASVVRGFLLFHDHPKVIGESIQKMSGWREREMARLQRATVKAKPLLVPRNAPRLVKRERVA